MASHCHHRHHHHQPPPSATQCCCNPCHCSTLSPPFSSSIQQNQLLQALASLLSQPQPHPTITIPTPHHTQFYTHHHSTLSSLLHRIETLESSLSHHHHHHPLRHAAARVIQTHFRSFLVRRSRTLSHLKQLASIKSTFNTLKSSLSNHVRVDFPSLSLKAMNLLLQLDSIEDCDPMIVDGKRSISRDLVRFLDAIEEVALKKHVLCVRTAKSKTVRSGQKVQKPRNSGDEDKRKLLQNLRGRVERLNRLCKVSDNDEGDSEPEEVVHDDGNGVTNVLIGRRDGVSKNQNGVFVIGQGVQPSVKKSVRFAENGNVCEVYSGDVTCSDGSSSCDEQREVMGNVDGAVEGAEGDDEVPAVDSGGSPHSCDDGERKFRRKILKNDGRYVVDEQLQAHEEDFLFSAPLPLKMENRTDRNNSKGVKILT